jgi:acetolactate synthase-1/2/3 large subunit
VTSSLASPNGGDALVAAMRRWGTDVAFGVVSVHNLPLVDAIARDLRWVPTRSEAAAVNAADGWARASGRTGVAITSTGSGAGNAAGALVEALTAGSAVVHVTGQVPTGDLGAGRGHIHEVPCQLMMLGAVSKTACTVLDGDASADLEATFHAAATPPRGPVSIEWPVDLQYLRCQVDAGGAPTGGASLDPDPDAVRAAAALLRASRRPLVWAGGGARRAGEALGVCLNLLPAGVVTSVSGRGVISEHDERVVGAFAASPACAPLLAQADLLLAVGTHFRTNETRDRSLQLPERQIQIDIDGAALGRSYPCEVGLQGEAGATLRAIAAELEGHPHAVDPGWADLVRATRDDVRRRAIDDAGPQGALVHTLSRRIPNDAVICRDVTIPTSTWGNRLLPITSWRSNLHAVGGGIGQGLATGIGAGIARPDVLTLVLAGDGGLAVGLGELATLAQERPNLLLVVFDDNGYGVLRNTQDAFIGRRAGVDLLTPDLCAVAAAVGLPASRVASAEAFDAAIEAALATAGPSVVVVDVDGIGPLPKPFTPPVKVG